MNSDADIVLFFRSLPTAARREYERLAELDRRYGEDVEAELREVTPRGRGVQEDDA